MPFELNCDKHLYLFFKKNTYLCSFLKIKDKLAIKLSELLAVCHENFYCAQKIWIKPTVKIQRLGAIFLVINFG